MSVLKGPTRFLAVVGKEIISVIRRPGALVSMIAGPFIIMAVFGLGYVGRPQYRAILVIPPDSGLPQSAAEYQEISDDTPVEIVGVMADPAPARAALADRRADLIVIAPSDGEARFKAGQQSVLVVEYNTEDPVSAIYADTVAAQLSAEANKLLIERAVRAGTDQAAQAGIPKIPAEVIAEPTKAEAHNLAPTRPSVIAFFGPAVLALIVQHMAVTLSALSMSRERFGGIIEVLRVAPIAASAILAGKLVALLVLVGGTAGILLGLMLVLLHVPMLGDPAQVVLSLAALAVASVSLGLALSVLADSERQAVQLALLALLASVFFGGFVLDLNDFALPVRIIGNALPVTHGIQLAQDLFLRGETNQFWRLGVLAAMGLVFFAIAWLAYRRTLRATA
ncbi:MAG TPA: ABC transporter permease [Candidatus Limnocylindria bacterium]|nr:ABC transporter permease [Candidatus Limnocylindria bacterium]